MDRPSARSLANSIVLRWALRWCHRARPMIAGGVSAIAIASIALGSKPSALNAAVTSSPRVTSPSIFQLGITRTTLPRFAAAQTPPSRLPEEVLATESELTAPSVIWLIVMPAVPIVGGTLIYLSRRWFGGEQQECRLVAHVTPTAAPTAEGTSQDDESP